VAAVIIEADGGSRGNPGPAGYGAVVKSVTGEVLAERYASLGVTTNNVAEYSGLIAGLMAAAELGADEVEVRMDSKLVVEQMSGRWQIKHPGLRTLAAEAAKLVQQFRIVRFGWIPRAENAHADRLANLAMDGVELGVPPSTATPAAAPTSSPFGAGAGSWEPPTLGPPLRMLLVRHGETEFTAAQRYSGRGDVPLSPIGDTQAKAVARRVYELAPVLDAVITSPLRRCQATARALAGGAPVYLEDDFVECDFGEWEGLTFAEVRERYGEEMRAWLASSAVPPPGGESFDQVTERVRAAVERLRQRYTGKTIAIVSHVTPLKMILRDALDATDIFLRRCFLDAAGLSIVDSWPDGGVAVRAINETAHLAPHAT
jgi:probable phosphoglycerate mutase